MAILFLAHNGIGLGHLARSLAICDALTALGEAPVIFAQGTGPYLGHLQYPGMTIPSIRKADIHERAAIIRDVERYATMSGPSVVFEDTHPCNLDLKRSIRRILVIRPTDFDYMSWLAEKYVDVYDTFLIADAPGSPTWIYDDSQTKVILGWPNWFVLGPVYRAPTEQQRAAVMERYQIQAGDPVCVLSMGGGGVRSASDDDLPRFVDSARTVGTDLQRIEPRTRLLFVKGPLFPMGVVLPREFEVISGEPHVPALISVARGAVIRPGFNTTWECLFGGVPFMPVYGTSYREPMAGRISRLQNLGLASFDLAARWKDPAWISARNRRAQTIRTQWPGAPDPTVLARQIRSTRRVRSFHSYAATDQGTSPPSKNSCGPRLGIRIDDVGHLDDNLRWLIERIVERKLHASLEVIPYLCRISEADLDAMDPDRFLTVSQHGYAHIPRASVACRRSEFTSEELPPEAEVSQIAAGREVLRARFPVRFSGGFSAPYDALPSWLGPLWSELGGQFISCIWARPRLAQIRVVYTSIETWDWKINAPLLPSEVLAAVRSSATRTGGAAVVIHPWLLSVPDEPDRIQQILDTVLTEGFRSSPISELPGPHPLVTSNPYENSLRDSSKDMNVQSSGIDVAALGQQDLPNVASGPPTTFVNEPIAARPESMLDCAGSLAQVLESLCQQRANNKNVLIALGCYMRVGNVEECLQALDLCAEYAATPEYFLLGNDIRDSPTLSDAEIRRLEVQLDRIDKELWSRGWSRNPLRIALEQLRHLVPALELKRAPWPHLIYCDSSVQSAVWLFRCIVRARRSGRAVRIGLRVPLSCDHTFDQLVAEKDRPRVRTFGSASQPLSSAPNEVQFALPSAAGAGLIQRRLEDASLALEKCPVGARHLTFIAGDALRENWHVVARELASAQVDTCSLEIPFWINERATSALEWVDLVSALRTLSSAQGWTLEGGSLDLLGLGLEIGNQHPEIVDSRFRKNHRHVALTVIAPVYNLAGELRLFLNT